jgi:hypothetical protein
MTNQPTDEAAVPEWMLPEPDDIIEALDRLIRQRTGTLDQWPQKPITEQRARDEIETLRAKNAELQRKLDEQTLVVQAIKVVTATAMDAVRGLQRIMALTRVAGITEQYKELQKNPFVAKAADLNEPITTIRDMLASIRGEA